MKPEQLEYAAPGPGQCVLHNMGGRLFVERADPVIAIAEIFVRKIRVGGGHADCHLEGDVLTIDGVNQRVTYRLEQCGQPGYLLGKLA